MCPNMGAALCRCRWLFGGGDGAHHKKEEVALMDDVEARGGIADDDEEWDEFPEEPMAAPGAAAGPAGPGLPGGAVPDPEAEEDEPDPFAGFDMAPSIKPTKRYVAVSAWEKPKAPTSGRFAMAAEEMDTPADGGGWDADEPEELSSGADRRRAAEERRQARRRERDGTTADASRGKPSRLKVAATKVSGP